MKTPLTSAVRSVLVRVRDLPSAKEFYARGLGLHCVAEVETISAEARQYWGLGAGTIRAAQFAQPGNPFGMIELIEWSGGSDEPIRDDARPCDYGLFTINYRTSDMTRALELLASFGATPVTKTQAYQAGGKEIQETMVTLATGERCTVLQVGETVETEHPFVEAVATVGAIVPSLAESLRFYRDALGLSVAVTLDQTGEPFASMLGAPPDTRLQMALLTSAGHWTGKYEFLQLTNAAERRDANARANGQHNGYWMMSALADDLSAVAQACQTAGATIVRPATILHRPFAGEVKTMLVRAPGGELLEVIEQCESPTD